MRRDLGDMVTTTLSVSAAALEDLVEVGNTYCLVRSKLNSFDWPQVFGILRPANRSPGVILNWIKHSQPPTSTSTMLANLSGPKFERTKDESVVGSRA